MNELWGLFISLLCIILIGVMAYPEGIVLRGAYIPGWCQGLAALLALIPAGLTLRAILRGEGKLKKVEYSDEDVAKAKAEMDRLYLKKYGKLPDYPQESQGEAPGPESKKD